MNQHDVLGRGPPEQDKYALSDALAEPEGELLRALFRGAPFVSRLARAPGGWRTLSDHELDELGLAVDERKAVQALQLLVQRSYPELPRHTITCPTDVGRMYERRLGGLVREVMVAVALDGRNHVIAELEIAAGGAHGFAVRPRDVLRPLLRTGASAFILLHNHPSGDPTPSKEDVVLTQRVAECAVAVDVPLVDHVVVGARGGGFVSLLSLGVVEPVG